MTKKNIQKSLCHLLHTLRAIHRLQLCVRRKCALCVRVPMETHYTIIHIHASIYDTLNMCLIMTFVSHTKKNLINQKRNNLLHTYLSKKPLVSGRGWPSVVV